MRWSLILTTFIAVQSALSFAVVIPSSDQLQRREPGGAKVDSKTYRKNSEDHAYAYKFDKTGGVTREWLKPSERLRNNQKTLMIPKTDADHVFEHQMLNNHLGKHGLKFDDLHPNLQKKVKGIINGPGNVAPVPAGINRGKGQLIKHALRRKAIAPKKDRDDYTKLSYGTARKTAKQLDQAFKDGGHDFGKNTLHRTLRKTMNNAKIMKSNDPSPASSRASSPGSNAGSIKGTPKRPARAPPRASSPGSKAGLTKGTPKRPGRVYPVGKSSPPKAPARKSGRNAAKLPNFYKTMM